MQRVHDWRVRLAKVINDAMQLTFTLGETDCALFAAACVEALTGADPSADFRGRYTTREKAIATLRDAGHEDLAALVSGMLEEIHPSRARAGDIALMPGDPPFGWKLGVFIGERIGGLTPTGYGTIARPPGLRAFKVGD